MLPTFDGFNRSFDGFNRLFGGFNQLFDGFNQGWRAWAEFCRRLQKKLRALPVGSARKKRQRPAHQCGRAGAGQIF